MTAQQDSHLQLSLCGDVMIGRGIDQVLPYPCNPVLYEPFVKSALEYVKLAEEANGPISQPVRNDYIWGDAMAEWMRRQPDARIVNLETSITRSPHYWKGKGINYRISPENAACLLAAGINCCCLGNNHVLDWGFGGLDETLNVLDRLAIKHAGAGHNLNEASAPGRLSIGDHDVAVFSMGTESSGVPPEWSASTSHPGVWYADDPSQSAVRAVCDRTWEFSSRGDRIVFSVHWGGNWGYGIPTEQKRFAQLLIDEGRVDIVYGHSAHHPKGIEVHRGKLILYGCGDFINDYEGINGYEIYRGDLCLMYFVTLEAKTGDLLGLEMVPFQIRKFCLNRASRQDVNWLHGVLDRECRVLGTRVEKTADESFRLEW